MTFYTSDLHQPGQQPAWLKCSAVQSHMAKDTSTLLRGCSAIPDPWHFWRDLNRCMLWDNFSFSSTPNRTPPSKVFSTTATVPTPCSCLCLTTKWISPLCRRKRAEKQRPVLVYYPQLKKLPFSKRKTLSLQTPLSCIHPPKGHSDLLAHFKKMTAHQCFLGILHKLGNRGRRTHSSSLRVPQDNSEIALLMQRIFSHYQVTEFLTP